MLNKIFPDLKNNITMENFINSFSKMITRLNENDGFKNLRQLIQTGLGINRGRRNRR